MQSLPNGYVYPSEWRGYGEKLSIPESENIESNRTQLGLTRWDDGRNFCKGFRSSLCWQRGLQFRRSWLCSFADPGCAPKSVTSQSTSDLVQTKKVLRTGAGTVTRTIKRTLAKRYVPGVLAQEIRLNYCTALGLIHAGVLPKPPLWVFHRMKHGVVKRSAMDGVGGTRKRTKRSDATLTATHSS